MIFVDHERCVYCGGCVPVCPVDAIHLEETNLQIDSSCIHCNLCLPACPVGALSPASATRMPVTVVRRQYDIVVVGGGPAGSMAAETAARRGLSVLLLEKRQEIGSPVRCAEGVSHAALTPFIEPDPAWVSATIGSEEIVALDGDREERLRFDDAAGRGYVLERRVFDRVLAERAVLAGAHVMIKAPAIGLLRDNGQVGGVTFEHNGTRYQVEAAITIGADGVESRVAKWAGLPLLMRQRDSLVCTQYLLAGIDVDPTCCVYYLGDSIAPGGYAWIFPKGEGRANVGIGVQADCTAEPAISLLDRWIEQTPALARGSIVTLVGGNIPTSIPPRRIVGGGVMLVGDAAHQADPISAGGITNAMLAGRLAAEVAADAIAAGDLSAGCLSEYPRRWDEALGRKMARNYALRYKYTGPKRASRAFMRVFAIAASGYK